MKVRSAFISVLLLANIAACAQTLKPIARPNAANKPSVAIYRQDEPDAAMWPATVVAGDDYAVWAVLRWARSFPTPRSFQYQWSEAGGRVWHQGTLALAAGVTYSTAGVKLPPDARPGTHNFKLLAGSEVLQSAAFTVAAPRPTTSEDPFAAKAKYIAALLGASKTPSKAVASAASAPALAAIKTPSKAAASAPTLAASHAVSAPAGKWAFIVGIHRYPGKDNLLPGTDKDATAMRNLLVDNFGFPADHVAVYRDEQATKAKIVSALRWFAERVGPNDAFVFYYAGHGTQVPDLDGDEEDGWDEAIVPYDAGGDPSASVDTLEPFLIDDEISVLLEKFKTANVTVIFDSCHSGTATRAGEGKPPSILGQPRVETFHFNDKLLDQAREAQQRRRPDTSPSIDISHRYVFLAAARPWETSVGGEDGGVFTSALTSVLKASSGENWDEIMARVEAKVSYRNFAQEPGAEGGVRRLPFTMTETAAQAAYRRPTLAVVAAMPSKPAMAQAPDGSELPISFVRSAENGQGNAVVAGLESVAADQFGALYDIYPPTFEGMPKGRVRISGTVLKTLITEGADSLVSYGTPAEIVSGSASRGDRLLARMVAVPGKNVSVVIGQAVKSPLEQKFAAALRAYPNIQVGGAFDNTDYAIEMAEQNGRAAARVWTRGRSVLKEFLGPLDDVARDVAQLVAARHSTLTRLSRISNPSAPFRVTAVPTSGQSSIAAGGLLGGRAESAVPAYFYVIAATGAGAPQVVSYPAAGEGKKTSVEWSARPPATFSGRVAIKVIASTQPLDFTKVTAAADRVDGIIAALQQLAGPTFVGSGFVGTDDWADSTVWYNVN